MSQNRQVSIQDQTLQRRPSAQANISAVPVTGTLTRLIDNTATRSLSTINPEEGSLWIDEAALKGHIVAPAMSMPVFPHGRGIVVSIVKVTNFDEKGGQIYPITGTNKFGLHKGILDDIGRGYGIDWPPEWTVDVPFTNPGHAPDPRDEHPWCIKVQVCGRYKKYDGTWATLPALTKETDLREYDPVNDCVPAEVEQIRVRQNNKVKADAELAQLRRFIRAHAQTKARLMVIGTLVRRSYTMEELRKPFFVFQSTWIGRSEDPEINRMFAAGALEMERGARDILYGSAPQTALPPVSDQPYHEDAEMVAYRKVTEAAHGSSGTVTSSASDRPTGSLKKLPEGVEGRPWVLAIPFGPHKGKLITDASVPDALLSQLVDYYMVGKDDPINASNLSDLDANIEALNTELDRRNATEKL